MSINTEEVVKFEAKGMVGVITLNRPQVLNAINLDLLISLSTKLRLAIDDDTINVILLTGAGEKAFAAGADISSMAQLGPRAIAEYLELGQRVMRELESSSKPVIAAVNGYALGGGLELALACDLIFASSSAKVGLPEVNLGIIPGFGGTQRLALRSGIGAAKRLIFSGEVIAAEEALRLSLVDRVVDPERLLAECTLFGETISKRAPLAVRAAKRAINRGVEQMLLAGLRNEVEEFLRLFATDDRSEGMAAFLQKREAQFKGR